MKNNLVLSNIKDTFILDSRNLIFCENLIEEFKLNKLKFSKIKHHWDIKEKIKKDYAYSLNFFYDSIKIFSNFLNQYHKMNQSIEYWQIIIGPYLSKIIPIVWDRWESVRCALENEKIDQIVKLENKNPTSIPNDFNEFYGSYISNHEFNYLIYFEAFKVLSQKKKLDIEIISKKFNNLPINEKVNGIKNNLFYYIYEKIFQYKRKNQKYLITRSYFSILNNININIKLKNLPFRYNEFDSKINKKKLIFRDDIKIYNGERDEFEKFFYSIIPKILPQSYLENFKDLVLKVKNLNINPEVIFTGNLHISSDIFKIWVAKKKENGSKLILSDHGGYLEDEIDFKLWNKVANFYVQWNKSKQPNSIQMPPNIMLKKKQIFSKEKKENFLILFNTEALYVQNFYHAKNPPSQYYIIKNFLNLFEDLKRKNFFFRPHPNDVWNIKDKIIQDFGLKRVDDRNDFHSTICNYKFIINTVPQTAFFETMASGVPNILLLQQDFLNLNEHVKELIKRMKTNNMLFDNIELAKNHILNIWENPNKWWEDHKTRQIRDEFQRVCSMKTKNDLLFWVDFLKKL